MRSVNGGYKVNVEEKTVNIFMLHWSMMMTNRMILTINSLAMGVQNVMTTEPV